MALRRPVGVILAWTMPDTDFPRPDPNTYWVLPGRFLAGEYPGAADPKAARAKLAAFARAGVNAFLDLTEGHELAPYAPLLPAGTEYRRLPIRDLGVPHSRLHMSDILDAVDDALARGRVVFGHGWGGIGGTGTGVACWLRRHGRTGEGALAELAGFWTTMQKRHRAPRSPETAGQIAWVHAWEEKAKGLA